MSNLKNVVLFLIIGLLTLVLSGLSFAGEFPNKPVKLAIAYGGGGSTDVTARMLSTFAADYLGQPIVCVNQPGGSGAKMYSLLKASKPDGYSIAAGSTSTLNIAPIVREIPFEISDFTYIMQYGMYSGGILVKGDSPFNTLEDLIKYVKSHPGEVTYTTSGTGSVHHMVMEYLTQAEGLVWTHVPSKSGSESTTTVLGGHVDVLSESAEWVPYVEAGQLKLLAISNPARFPAFPDVPTLKDLGYGDYAVESGLIITGPAGMDEDVRKKIETAFIKATAAKDFKEVMDRLLIVPFVRTGEELKEFMPKSFVVRDKLIRSMGLAKDQ